MIVKGLKVKRVRKHNPRTGQMGYSVATERTMHVEWDDLLEMATDNSTLTPAEAEMAWSMIRDRVLGELKNGNSVELRGLGTLRMQVGAPWQEQPQDIHRTDIHASLRFEPHWRLRRWM